jgi:hypothetical protein
MSDKGIKSVIIKKELLGKVTSSNFRVVRFRIISEDRNRKSAYSKIFITKSDSVIVGQGDTQQSGNTISVTWSFGKNLLQTTYDIFAGFDGEEPSYLGSTTSQNYSFLKNGTESVRVLVQISSISPIINDELQVYDSEIVSLV